MWVLGFGGGEEEAEGTKDTQDTKATESTTATGATEVKVEPAPGPDKTFMQYMEKQQNGTFKLKSLDGLFGLYFRNRKDADKRAAYTDVAEPLQGDVYRYLALYGRRAQTSLQFFGMMCVMLIQLIGPPLIFMSNARSLEWSKCSIGLGGATGLDAFQTIATRILGALFLALFILNGWRYNADSLDSATKLKNMLSKLEMRFNRMASFKTLLADNTDLRWIAIGAFVNSWVIIFCTLDMSFVLMLEDGVKDVVMDSLGLLFLYNLDDVTGDFALLDESDWDEERMGQFYVDISADTADLDNLPDNSVTQTFPRKTCEVLHDVTRGILILFVVLPVIVLLVNPSKSG
eukprot:TRINITY_DN44727_c0_g1_i1.p1 TRINITY_DN44727_c0_g1~~TRINITY_DN44727_c0_g1_i1.p1  ORF type:complete len:346 (-),score=54.51 TRINITY_DN44727_c0_g1_i1:139-1176(-)